MRENGVSSGPNGQKETDNERKTLCDMRGMLSFRILWLLSKRPMYGQELAAEIGKRKGNKPNPGTIYPALKLMSKRKLVQSHLEGRNTVYELTKLGRLNLSRSIQHFRRAFGEILA